MSPAHVHAKPVNPHVDEDLFVWDDAYCGKYQPVAYDGQFDDQWRFFLEKKEGFHRHTGSETDDFWINDRICDLTGVADFLSGARNENGMIPASRQTGGTLMLEPKFPVDFFQGKACLDVGCGAGRWTKTLMALGGRVKSVDVSRHGLESTRRFNDDVEEADVFSILKHKPQWRGRFDFTLCWGVLMCTHDPRLAFENVSSTVKPGGHLYVMVYAPTYHASEFVINARKHYHRNLTTLEEKLEYAYSLAEDKANTINYFDMLNTFYNWTIPKETVLKWFQDAGYDEITLLNENEPHNCAWHVLGKKGGKP